MGLYSEQINTRMEMDDLLFEETLQQIGDAVMGARLTDALSSDSIRAKSVIDDVLRSYGFKPANIPENIKDFEEQLEYAMRPHGIMWRRVKLEPGWEHNAVGTLIGVYKDSDKVVALLPKGSNGYKYYDDQQHKSISVNRNTEKNFDSEAILFYKPLPSEKISPSGFIRFMFSSWSYGDYAVIIAGFAAVSLLGLFTPSFNNFLFSKVAVSGNIRLLIAAAIAIVCITISTKLFATIKNLIFEARQIKMSAYTESALMTRVLNLPVGFFKKYSSGNLANRVMGARALVSSILTSVFSVGLTVVMSLVYLFQIFTYAAPLALPAILVLVVVLIVSILATYLGIRSQKETMDLDAKESGLVFALISGIRKIRSTGSEKRAFAKWGDIYSKSSKTKYNPPVLLKYSQVITAGTSLIGTIFIYFLAVKNNIPLADYYAFTTAFSMTSAAFSLVASSAGTFAMIKPAMEMIQPILEEEPEAEEQRTLVTKMRGDIEISHVSFRYEPNLPLILDDFSLKIKRGQYVAIVGRSGCGKSTLIRLLLGFEKPESGSIYYDDKDMDSLDLKSLRRNIGCVMQGGKLLTESLFANIAAAAPNLTLDEAWEAAEIAGMGDEIRKMPMGMNTMISEGAGGISGGQKQRLLIARAIAPKPKVLIFDEATSALDNITQKKVSNALDSLKCTRIVIAHRLSTIKNCDRILVLDKGKIIEDGTYDELIKQNGFFADLVERQRL